MKNNIFDSHAHYDSEAFDADRKELLNALQQQGVCGIINCASDMASSLTSLSLADEFGFVYAACGVHPHEAEGCKDGYISVLKKLCSEEKCVAVGEIGLDYHYDFSPREIQKKVFEEQLVLAKELDLPVIIHCREGLDEILEVLDGLTIKPKGVFHSFGGTINDIERIRQRGDFYFGINGIVTFKNSKLRETLPSIGINRILLETDSPYLAPVPHRGKCNESAFIIHTAAHIAQHLSIPLNEIASTTSANAKLLFKI